MIFTQKEVQRYARHFSLDMIGLEGQSKLKNSAVLCVGAGGIGSPALLYLAAAGVGKIGVVDGDKVEMSNLQRQVIFNESAINSKKAKCAAKKLKDINSSIDVVPYSEWITKDNASNIISEYDIVLDGSDNFPTRYLTNHVCHSLGNPLVSASILRFTGQLSVFNFESGPCYRCLYPEPPSPGSMPNCAQAGVLGTVTGIIGTMAANEILKILLNIGDSLNGTLLLYDALRCDINRFPISKNANCSCCSVMASNKMPSFSVAENIKVPSIGCAQLQDLLQESQGVVLLDVRESWEIQICKIPGAIHIPLAQLEGGVELSNKVNVADRLVVYCKSGGRSAKAVQLLLSMGYANVVNLTGGIIAWGEANAGAMLNY